MRGEPHTLPAPAKLNLFLHVTGRRADGYHLLETVFEMIDLCDQVSLQVREDGLIRRLAGPEGVPAEQDLTVRAARLLAQHTGCRLGVDISVNKHIPMGGGLGGGSSDAATVLLGLNRLWSLRLGRGELAQLGLQLGADVPFFIFGETAYATGVGEQLEICPQPGRHYVLIAPGVPVATPGVFSDPGLTRDTKPLKIFGLLRGQSVFRGRNDLEAVVERSVAAVSQSLSALREAALRFAVRPELVRMSGSGSSVFLPVPESLQDQVCRYLRDVGNLPGSAQVISARSVPRHPLRDWAFA